MSEANDKLNWVRRHCKFAQFQGTGGSAVTPDHLLEASRAGIENMLKSMGQGNPDIAQDVIEAKPIIDTAIRNMAPAMQTLAQQLTQFFTEKTQDRSVVNPQNVQQAVQNPAAPIPQQ
jgi:hypothetical protein